MTSALFTINGTAIPAAVAVGASSTVTLQLTDLTGAVVVQWAIDAASESHALPTITPSGALGATATFMFPAAPAHGRGLSLLVRCTVTDGSGQQVTKRGICGIVSPSGMLLVCYGETDARGSQGWTDEVNIAIATANSGTLATTVNHVDFNEWAPGITYPTTTGGRLWSHDGGLDFESDQRLRWGLAPVGVGFSQIRSSIYPLAAGRKFVWYWDRPAWSGTVGNDFDLRTIVDRWGDASAQSRITVAIRYRVIGALQDTVGGAAADYWDGCLRYEKYTGLGQAVYPGTVGGVVNTIPSWTLAWTAPSDGILRLTATTGAGSYDRTLAVELDCFASFGGLSISGT